MSSTSWYQFLAIAGALAVVDSVLIGGTLGVAVQVGTGTLVGDGAGGVNTGAGGWPDNSRGSERPGAAASVSTTVSQ